MSRIVKIFSENDKFQYIEVLKRNRQKRHKYKVFFVEGVKAINNVLENNWDISAFVYTREQKLSHWAENIINNSQADTHYELPASLMNKISDKEESSELIALVKMKGDKTNQLKFRSTPLIVVLDRPMNPGNIGTIIRSCDSFKVDGMIITGHSADLYDPQTIRASVGTIFTLPVIRMGSHKELINWVNRIKIEWGEIKMVGSSSKAEKVLTKVDFQKPTILLLGNETKGLSENFKSICDELVMIPIYGTASSLNLASAASIFLYEIDKQRSIKK
ncbi:TrmH family RNA methyltransferase [Candidatus Cloacimonadota bacterium]